jgi:hypothetical protein
MKKYLVQVYYTTKNNVKMLDDLIITSYKDFEKADYKIRQVVTNKYNNVQVTDIRVLAFDLMECYTVK